MITVLFLEADLTHAQDCYRCCGINQQPICDLDQSVRLYEQDADVRVFSIAPIVKKERQISDPKKR